MLMQYHCAKIFQVLVMLNGVFCSSLFNILRGHVQVNKQMRVFSCYDEASCDDALTRCPEFRQSAALGLDIEVGS